jgi:RNA polymerase primary sigma factor
MESFQMTKGDDELISAYLSDIARIPLISREQEKELARKAHTGDVAAKQQLVNANLRFVITVAKQYTNRGLDFLDLINEGNIALIEAIDTFDETKGYRFITYAVRRIKQDMLRALSDKGRAIHLPANRVSDLSQIAKARSYIRNGNGGHALSEKEVVSKIAAMRGLDEGQVRSLEASSRSMVSLDAPVEADDNSSTLADFVEDRNYRSPEDELFMKNMNDDLNKALALIPERERTVLQLHEGLGNKEPLTLEEIGKQLNVTRERVRQLESHAKLLLKSQKIAVLLEAYVA